MSGSDNATLRLSWGQIRTQRFTKTSCLTWLLTFPGTALGESLLCHDRSVYLKDITDVPTVRACSLLQGHSRPGTWTANKKEAQLIGAAVASGGHTHSGAEGIHSFTSISHSLAVWANRMFSSVVDASWTAGRVLQSSFGLGRTSITKLMQNAANRSQPSDGDVDETGGMIADKDMWDAYPGNGNNAFYDLLPLQLHLQGISLDTLMDRITETHSVLLRYYDNRDDGSSLTTKPRIIRGDSIAQLVEILRSELSKACHLPESKFLMSSVHGRFLRPQGASQFLQHNTSDGVLLQGLHSQSAMQGNSDLVSVVEEPDQRIAEEVVVRFFVLGNTSLVQKVIDKLRAELMDKESELMTGKLSKLLQRASITVGYENNYMLTANNVRGIEGLFVPVIVSVIFMMMLMWLSSI
eukprot:TRINITY_DN22917_c0_g1_i1.p1 TRINITY_DN22917_c0_g1~~TRINITY_DN22917_c0_g1_i1.p1  ORF type:complete len:409 (+),score=58.73 TRINITY_DN22917_c0_g1_i1:107-1333(+)